MKEEIHEDKLSSIALWITITVFVIAVLCVILYFDSQDDQDRKLIEKPREMGDIVQEQTPLFI